MKTFWDKVTVNGLDGCWIWRAGLNSNGYGMVRFQGKVRSAHRVSYELTHKPIPSGMVVMHSCDNKRCVNPNHLSIGTHMDNIQDMDKKGRGNRVRLPGVRNGRAKLTELDIRSIQGSVESGKALSKKWGISQTRISLIRNGKVWSHLPCEKLNRV